MIYDASTPTVMDRAVSLSKSRDAGFVYVTNDGLADPYDTLPPAPYGPTSRARSHRAAPPDRAAAPGRTRLTGPHRSTTGP